MRFFKRNWTAAEADEWTREDALAIVLSPIAYVLIMIGTALSFLLLWPGFVLLGIGIIATIIMHWVIDPKLKAISDEFESKQKDYILDLERNMRWEETDE
ncbi:hypothetical protein HQ585_09310 [candidate division KSB1 bacterium]|nr:hypothetical protein [candidate division KSB1 bacterium]